MLYNKQSVYHKHTSTDRRIHDGKGITTTGIHTKSLIVTLKKNYAKDLNIDERATKFKDQLKDEYVYRVPLKCFSDIGKIIFSLKINFRIKSHLETNPKVFSSLKRFLHLAQQFQSLMQK